MPEESNTPETVAEVTDAKPLAGEKTAEIDIDIKEKPKDNKTTVSFKDSSWIKDHIKQQATPPPKSEEKPKENIEEIRARIDRDIASEISNLTVEDYEDMADFFIDLIDMALLFFIQWYAKDPVEREYKIPEDKLKKLKKHLTRILIRLGKKFPLGLMFIFMFAAAYVPVIRRAHTHRQLVIEEKKLNQLPHKKRSRKDNSEH